MKATNDTNTRAQYLTITFSAITLVLIAYYVLTRAFPMLIISEENYGAYFFPRAGWLFPHIVLGIVATVIGPFQFVTKFRNKHLKLHRQMGRVYILSIILSSIGGMYLAATSGVNLPYAAGLFGLGVTWSVSAIMAYISIKNKKVDLHKEWMIRSYVITLAFVSFRFVDDILTALEIGSKEEVLVLMSWACWAVPLFVAEVFIQGKKIRS